MSLFNTSTDAILSVFTKTIKKLESHAESMRTDIDTMDVAILVAQEHKAKYKGELDKANNAINKLKEFLA